MEIVNYRKIKDPFASVQEEIKTDDVYIVNFIARFEDGDRVISIGIKHRCYAPNCQLIDEFTAVRAVVSPQDNYNKKVEKEVILGRLKKNKLLDFYLDSTGLIITRKFIETVAEIIAFGVLYDLNKKYKQVSPKKS